jgi:hypothetical protein
MSEPQPLLISKLKHDLDIENLNNTFNTYATSKSYSQNLLNISLILSLVSTIVTTLSGPLTPRKISMLIFVFLSILLQLIMFIMLVILAKSTTEKIGKSCTATQINISVTILSGILPIITGTISILNMS